MLQVPKALPRRVALLCVVTSSTRTSIITPRRVVFPCIAISSIRPPRRVCSSVHSCVAKHHQIFKRTRHGVIPSLWPTSSTRSSIRTPLSAFLLCVANLLHNDVVESWVGSGSIENFMCYQNRLAKVEL